MWKIFVALAVIIMIGVAVAMWKFRKKLEDPGGPACDAVIERTKTEDGRNWDLHVDQIGSELTAKGVKLPADSRDVRCRAMFKELYDRMNYGKFEKLVTCVETAPSNHAQADCLKHAIFE